MIAKISASALGQPFSTGVFTCTTCFGPTDGGCGVHGNDLAGHQNIEEHPDRGQVLLHRGRPLRIVLDVRGDHDRIDFLKRIDALHLAPRKELGDSVRVGNMRVVPVSDRRGEELDEPPGGAVSGAGPIAAGSFSRPGARDLTSRDW